MSVHVCKCHRNGIAETHLRYPGMSESEARALADSINAGAFPYVEGFKKRIAELETALGLAIDAVEDWRLYASPFFEKKRDLKNLVCRLQKVLKGETP